MKPEAQLPAHRHASSNETLRDPPAPERGQDGDRTDAHPVDRPTHAHRAEGDVADDRAPLCGDQRDGKASRRAQGVHQLRFAAGRERRRVHGTDRFMIGGLLGTQLHGVSP